MTEDPRLTRRDFLGALAAGAAASGAAQPRRRPPIRQSAALPVRRLGATGLDIPILALGGFHVGGVATEVEARRVVEAAFEEGVRLFDNAESYQDGRAERWVGTALAGVRADVLLMSKSFDFPARRADTTRRHLEESLERLGTESLDLYQLHSVRSVEDVDRAFRAGGSMEAVLEAKERGVTRFIGVTGHADPAANLRAVEFWDRGYRFDAMQMPLNPIDYHQRSFQREVLPALVERGIGVIAMKTSADGRLLAEGVCTVDECLRYAWSLPVDVAVVGMPRLEFVRHNAALAREFAPMTGDVLSALRARIAPRADLALEWYKGE